VKSLEQLYNEQMSCAAALATAKAAKAAVDAEIVTATKSRVMQLYELTGKSHGTVSADVGTFTAKADISKEVKWDSGVLMSVASKMSWEEATKIFKIEFGVPEKAYKELTPDLKAAVDAGRTTKYGDVKVVLEKKT
jgi:hypothetical protein